MERGDLIPEAEAIILAGVSAKTLNRFTDAGYLHIDLQPDGMRRYARSEIHEIFGIHRAEITPSTDYPADRSNGGWEPAAMPLGDSESEIPSVGQVTQAIDLSETTRTQTSGPLNEQVTDSPSSSGSIQSGVDRPDAMDEIARLKNLVTLQEKLLDLKDSEVTDLRAQRDWLQRRVEKLEEKGDRDQILILSETQTIRKLVAMQAEKRSTVRQFLNWLGFAPQNQLPQLGTGSGFSTHGESIEVARAGNE